MKICCVSDLHGYLPEIPDCDVLILAGDYSPNTKDEVYWLSSIFKPWLRKQSQRFPVIGIAGNHDFTFQRRDKPQLPWTYLEDSDCTILGLKIYGTPWQPYFYDWAFNLYEPELEQKWGMIPDDTDILVVHGPPQGYGDVTNRHQRVGSPSLTKRIQAVQPKLVVCGHIHEGYGIYQLGPTIVANCAIMDHQYNPSHSVSIIDLPELP